MKAFWVMFVLFVITVVIAMILNMYFIAQGVMLGILMLFAVGFSYVMAKDWIKRTVMWGPIAWILDFTLSWGLTYGMGYSVTGFTAALVFGLLISFVIKFEQNRLKNEAEEKKAMKYQKSRYTISGW